MASLHISAAIFVLYTLVSLVWPLRIKTGFKLILGVFVIAFGLKYVVYSHFGSILMPDLPPNLIVTMEAAYSALMLMALMAMIKDIFLFLRWLYRKFKQSRARQKSAAQANKAAASGAAVATKGSVAASKGAVAASKGAATQGTVAAHRQVGKSEFIFVNKRSGYGRPRLLLHSAIAALALVAGFGGTISQFSVPDVVEHEIAIKNLPEELEGFTIVQLTDLHIGPILKRDFLAGVVARTNELKPDLVVITGDLVDGPVSVLKDEFQPLDDLKASYGVLAVTGNHEYYSGVNSWLETWEAQGITFLDNEHVRLLKVPLAIAGVPDPRMGLGPVAGVDVNKALKTVRPYPFTEAAYRHWSDGVTAVGVAAGSAALNVSSYVTDALSDVGQNDQVVKILLAHEPTIMAQNPEVDLVLTGHTHGGTMFFLQPLIARFNLGYVSGLYQVNERTKLYVSNGTGIWSGFSCRVLVPAEITRFTLRRAD